VSEVCGWGGLPRCRVRLPRRGLCDDHRAALARVRDECSPGRLSRATPIKKPPRPPDAPDAIGRLPIRVRAERVAKAAAAAPDGLTRERAAQAAGLRSAGGSLPRVLTYGRQRGWIAPSESGPHARIRAGTVDPSA
jgi:hypothetical protein